MSRPSVASLTVERDAWRDRALRAEKQVDQLTKSLTAITAPKPPPKHTPRQMTPDVEGEAVRRAETTMKTKAREAFIARAQKDLQSRGYSERDAKREATRLADEALSTEVG